MLNQLADTLSLTTGLAGLPCMRADGTGWSASRSSNTAAPPIFLPRICRLHGHAMLEKINDLVGREYSQRNLHIYDRAHLPCSPGRFAGPKLDGRALYRT